MSSDSMVRFFLNREVRGDQTGAAAERTFVVPKALPRSLFDIEYFDALPTVFANAYAFQKSLDAEPQGGRDPIEEWVSLAYLHFVGELRYQRIDLGDGTYDPEIKPVIDNTYPQVSTHATKGVSGVEFGVFKSADGQVVGGFYPPVAFFPARERSRWLQCARLKPFLSPGRIETGFSWAKCKEALERTPEDKAGFIRYALSIPVDPGIRKRVKAFLGKHGYTVSSEDGFALQQRQQKLEGTLPDAWVSKAESAEPIRDKLFEAYPFYSEPKRALFLPVGMDPSCNPWMTQAIYQTFTPGDYRKTGRGVSVFRGSKEEASLSLEGKVDEVVTIRNLLLPTLYWCTVSGEDAGALKMVDPWHIHGHGLESDALRNFFPEKADRQMVCLMPVTRDLLELFPEVLENPSILDLQFRSQPGEGAPRLICSMRIPGAKTDKRISWVVTPQILQKLPSSPIHLWPPKFDRRWHLYFGYGTCVNSYQWNLVGVSTVTEDGDSGPKSHTRFGDIITFENQSEPYVSILNDRTPIRDIASNATEVIVPRAMMLASLIKEDGGKPSRKERGLVVLKIPENDRKADASAEATLAVDLGTTNTCLAFQEKGKAPKVLSFEKEGLSPATLWGRAPESEFPGAVPFKWTDSEKGFFPTIMLTRNDLTKRGGSDISASDLVRVNIPSWHDRLSDRLIGQNYDGWLVHTGLKGGFSEERRWWRNLFVGYLLLHAHAKLLFDYSLVAGGKYIFTFPLAHDPGKRKIFLDDMQQVAGKVREATYGKENGAAEIEKDINESIAIAQSGVVNLGSDASNLDVFVDIGGGTTDIAIRWNKKFIVLDSVRVAGNTILQFTEENLPEGDGKPFRRKGGGDLANALQILLLGGKGKLLMPYQTKHLDWGNYFSLMVNRLKEGEYKDREMAILNGVLKAKSYQVFRTELFYLHVLGYSLLQALAASTECEKKVTNINFVLAGNAWGFLAFALKDRGGEDLLTLTNQLLSYLKENLGSMTPDGDAQRCVNGIERLTIRLASSQRTSEAKTAVATGALLAYTNGYESASATVAHPFSCVEIKSLLINDKAVNVSWNERWSYPRLTQLWKAAGGKEGKFFSGGASAGQISDVSFKDFDETTLRLLQAFVWLSGTDLPSDSWESIKTALRTGGYIDDSTTPKTMTPPMKYFFADVLYPDPATCPAQLLEKLAEGKGLMEG